MSDLLVWAAANTIVVSALLAPVWLTCRLLSTRPAVQHLLWLLLLTRLVMPPLLAWPLSWLSVKQSTVLETSRLSAVEPPAGVHHGAPTINDTIDQADTTILGNLAATPRDGDPAVRPDPLAWRELLTELASVGWGCGSLVVLVLVLRGCYAQYRLVRSSMPAPAWMANELSRVAAGLGTRAVPIVVSDQIATPMIGCLGRPRLLWPSSLISKQVVGDCNALLAHELAHVARRDHLTALFELAVTVVCWWNPLAWFLRRKLRESRELACDALALARPHQLRGDYARLLLTLATRSPASMLAAPAFGGGADAHFLRRRLTMVFDQRTNGRVDRRGALLVLLLAALALPGLATAQSDAPFVQADPAAKAPDLGPNTFPGSSSPRGGTSGQGLSYTRLVNPVKELPISQAHVGVRLEDLTPGKWTDLAIPGDPRVVRLTRNEDGSLTVSFEQQDAVSHRSVDLDKAYPVRGRTPGGSPMAADEPPGPRRATFDAEMLRTDLELAEVNVAEKQTQLELLHEEKAPPGKLRLAELAVQRAKLELRRCRLKLEHSQSPPGGN